MEEARSPYHRSKMMMIRINKSLKPKKAMRKSQTSSNTTNSINHPPVLKARLKKLAEQETEFWSKQATTLRHPEPKSRHGQSHDSPRLAWQPTLRRGSSRISFQNPSTQRLGVAKQPRPASHQHSRLGVDFKV
ncbi:hypothetical protein PIB30_095567 [Stylosanthes scabra]|uniref:Uncharacterized protein n=1 Tax=Stylosanthes scabra TaxID=79078 RepID=A0ABU6UUL1_9FABA|nr:hypothetical protein [Stylosanthes scabra]